MPPLSKKNFKLPPDIIRIIFRRKNKATTQKNILYLSLNGITLYRKDCLEGMRELHPKSADLVVTSPPYNIGKQYNIYNDKRPREEYLNWLEKVGQEVKRVLADDGSFFLNVGGRPSDPWIPMEVAQRLKKHFVLQNVIHWVKSIAIESSSVGHYKPIGGKRFLNDCHEYIFHFTKTGSVQLDRLAIGVPYQDKSNIGRWKSAKADIRCRGNTWFIPYETIHDRKSQRPHPSTFPVALPEMCIKLHGIDKTKLVVDPFMGMGSTAIACLNLGLRCIGFEVDEEYLKLAATTIRSLRKS